MFSSFLLKLGVFYSRRNRKTPPKYPSPNPDHFLAARHKTLATQKFAAYLKQPRVSNVKIGRTSFHRTPVTEICQVAAHALVPLQAGVQVDVRAWRVWRTAWRTI